MTGPTNVFEWCWEHSTLQGGHACAVLLYLAFHAKDDQPSPWPERLETDLSLSEHDINYAVGILIGRGELGFDFADGLGAVYTFPAYETARLPHTLTLSTWDGEPYDGEDAHRWDEATIECPHQPATETMPCAVWEPCGCPVDNADAPLYDGGDGDGSGPCARSVTGTHRYVEGEPNRPVASCFALDWEASIADRAFELGLMPGTHLVRPWWDGDRVQLELVEPQTAGHAVQHETLAHRLSTLGLSGSIKVFPEKG